MVNAETGEITDVPLTPEEIAEREAAAVVSTKTFRIEELRRLLASTDHKVLPDYDHQDPAISAQRQAWRDEIRVLLAS
jgi:hypothetical protein